MSSRGKPSKGKHGGSRAGPRHIRIVADRRDPIDHYRLARALLRLAQIEYDREHGADPDDESPPHLPPDSPSSGP